MKIINPQAFRIKIPGFLSSPISLILLIMALPVSCELLMPDRILTTQPTAMIYISKIDSIAIHEHPLNGSCKVYYPGTNNTYDLDIDQDGYTDFTFSHGYFELDYYSPAACGPMYGYSISCRPADSSRGVAITTDYEVAEFRVDDIINDTYTYDPGYITLFYQSELGSSGITSSNAYIGVRITKEKQTYYGWVYLSIAPKGLALHSWAVNLQDSRPILAGQVE